MMMMMVMMMMMMMMMMMLLLLWAGEELQDARGHRGGGHVHLGGKVCACMRACVCACVFVSLHRPQP
jgi:hypothetical protein